MGTSKRRANSGKLRACSTLEYIAKVTAVRAVPSAAVEMRSCCLYLAYAARSARTVATSAAFSSGVDGLDADCSSTTLYQEVLYI